MKIFAVSPWNDVWETSVEIFYDVSLPLDLNSACSWSKVCFSQSEALPDLPWHLISVEFLNSFLRQSSDVFSLPRSQASIFFLGARLVFAGKLLAASPNVDCFLKLSNFLHTYNVISLHPLTFLTLCRTWLLVKTWQQFAGVRPTIRPNNRNERHAWRLQQNLALFYLFFQW